MDTKTLIKSLRTLFSSENKIEKKYTKVWMNRIIALGFYDTKKFELNVQYDKPIPEYFKEIKRIIGLLHEKIEGSLGRIGSVDVHYIEDGYYHCHGDDILVYDDENDTA